MEQIRVVDGWMISGAVRGSVLLVIIIGWLMPGTSVVKTMASETANEVFV